MEGGEEEGPGGSLQSCLPLHEAAAALLSLFIGATIGLTGHPVAAGVAFMAGVALYLAGSHGPVRLSAALFAIGVHAAYLSRLQSEKLVLPLLVVERGPIGASMYPDIAQAMLAYEVYTRYKNCRRRETLKAPEEHPDPPGRAPR